VEGDEQMTDARRGSGVYRRLSSAMDQMLSKGIFYGVSVTLTKMNLEYATGEAFLDQLRASGCRVVVYVEYVPAAPGTEYITLSDMDRAVLEERLGVLRRADDAMLFISFPGDEGLYGGCLAQKGLFSYQSAERRTLPVFSVFRRVRAGYDAKEGEGGRCSAYC
jgi:MoaA/NifB/PqqE/SkfB family radical SAM enzyme